jgi:predicted DNA-binding transcriptional regulator AlpA
MADPRSSSSWASRLASTISSSKRSSLVPMFYILASCLTVSKLSQVLTKGSVCMIYTVERQQLRQRIVRALGDGGTMDMADRIVDLVGVLAAEHLQNELLGMQEVADLMGVTANTISMRAARPGMNFPAPIVHLSGSRIWSRAQIEEWMAGNPKLVRHNAAEEGHK